MRQRRSHADFFVDYLFCPQGGVTVGLVHHLAQMFKRELPDRVFQVSDGLAGKHLKAFVHRLLVVAHAAFAKELGLAVVGVPARMSDPAAHKVVAPRNAVNIQRCAVSADGADFLRCLRGASLIGVQAENPFVGAGSQGLVAQVAKALKFHLYYFGA